MVDVLLDVDQSRGGIPTCRPGDLISTKRDFEMGSNFDQLVSDLDKASKARNIRRQRSSKDAIMAKALAAHAQGAMTTSAVKSLERAIDAGVALPETLLAALAAVPLTVEQA